MKFTKIVFADILLLKFAGRSHMKVTEIEAIDEDGKEILISVAMFSNKDYKTLRRKESMAVSQTSYGLMIAIDDSQEKDMIEILKQMGLKTNVLG